MPSDNGTLDALKKIYQDAMTTGKKVYGESDEDESKIGTNITKNMDMDKYKAFKKGFNY